MCEGWKLGGEGREAVSLFEPHVRLSAPPTLIVERGVTIAGGLSSPLRHETLGRVNHFYLYNHTGVFLFIMNNPLELRKCLGLTRE